MGGVDTPSTEPDPGDPVGDPAPARRLRPPGAVFHAFVAGVTLGLLAALSLPVAHVFMFMLYGLGLMAAALVWLVWLVVFVAWRVKGRPTRRARWWFVLPVGAVVTVSLLAFHVPLRARWAVSRSDFARTVALVQRDPARAEELEGQIGWYSINSIQVVDGGVLFRERTGGFFDDSGFAYLPDGPDADGKNMGLESPEILHLSGPWYAWSASW